jgi:hypothetical protein
VIGDTTETGVSRRHLLEAAGVAAVAAVGLAGPAAGAPPEPKPFKASVKGKITSGLVIPLSPPISSAHLVMKGDVPGLGAVDYVEEHTGNVGVDGQPKTVTNARGAMTSASGDALFFTWSGFVRISATGEITGDGIFIITGGQGRFCGASGSGTVLTHPNLATGDVAFEWDGMIVAPAG